jgi:hypothetical protein
MPIPTAAKRPRFNASQKKTGTRTRVAELVSTIALLYVSTRFRTFSAQPFFTKQALSAIELPSILQSIS